MHHSLPLLPIILLLLSPVITTALLSRQLVVPKTGTLVVTCGPCSAEAPDHAPCFACSGAGPETTCSDPLSVPCGKLAEWLGEHADPAGAKGDGSTVDGTTILTCTECGRDEEADGRKSLCTTCRNGDCSKPYAIACAAGGDLGLGDLVGLARLDGHGP